MVLSKDRALWNMFCHPDPHKNGKNNGLCTSFLVNTKLNDNLYDLTKHSGRVSWHHNGLQSSSSRSSFGKGLPMIYRHETLSSTVLHNAIDFLANQTLLRSKIEGHQPTNKFSKNHTTVPIAKNKVMLHKYSIFFSIIWLYVQISIPSPNFPPNENDFHGSFIDFHGNNMTFSNEIIHINPLVSCCLRFLNRVAICAGHPQQLARQDALGDHGQARLEALLVDPQPQTLQMAGTVTCMSTSIRMYYVYIYICKNV